jgi:phosphohistidine phosphatase
MGRFLTVTRQLPDVALVSPALRARQTLEVAMQTGNWDCEVQTCEALYGEVDEVLDAIHSKGEAAKLLLIVGHEPTWSRLASKLTNGATLRLPTASMLRLDFEAEVWRAVGDGGRISWLVTPRLLYRTPLASSKGL